MNQKSEIQQKMFNPLNSLVCSCIPT